MVGSLDDINHSLCSMAERQDEKIDMVFGMNQWDDYQSKLIDKTYK